MLDPTKNTACHPIRLPSLTQLSLGRPRYRSSQSIFKTRVAVYRLKNGLSYESLRRHDGKRRRAVHEHEQHADHLMGILYPKEPVARRWDGALQARLRRAPLEAFLLGRSLVPAPAGASRDTDNLVRATVLIVEGGLELYCSHREEGLAFNQRPVVGHVACLVSLALAQQISEQGVWRNVALLSAARLLSPWIGLNAASVASASSARQFQKEIVKGVSPLDWRIMNSACEAVSFNGPSALAKASWNVAARLNAEAPLAAIGAPLRESQPG